MKMKSLALLTSSMSESESVHALPKTCVRKSLCNLRTLKSRRVNTDSDAFILVITRFPYKFNSKFIGPLSQTHSTVPFQSVRLSPISSLVDVDEIGCFSSVPLKWMEWVEFEKIFFLWWIIIRPFCWSRTTTTTVTVPTFLAADGQIFLAGFH